MRLIRQLLTKPGPMPAWERWLVALLIIVTSPIWLPATVVVGIILAVAQLFTPKRGDYRE